MIKDKYINSENSNKPSSTADFPARTSERNPSKAKGGSALNTPRRTA